MASEANIQPKDELREMFRQLDRANPQGFEFALVGALMTADHVAAHIAADVINPEVAYEGNPVLEDMTMKLLNRIMNSCDRLSARRMPGNVIESELGKLPATD